MTIPETTAEARKRLSRLSVQACRRWAPPPKLTLSGWADTYRRLSPEASSEPGQWYTDRIPYLREPMDCVTDPACEWVVLKFASQSAKTEILLNATGYYMHQDPSPMLFVEPRLEDCKALSKDRIAPMVRDAPALRSLVRDPRARDSGNTTLHKVFPGGHLTLAGANSPAGLAMRPIRVVMCDEVSRYEASAGTEGDPVSLAVTRTTTFWNRKIILASSPGLEGECRISKAFNDTDQRHYYVPCPDCGHMQTLEWSHVEWQKDASEHKPDTARYRCDACGTLWSDGARWKVLRDGEWRAHAPFRGRAGFTISQLYSPWKRLGELATEYLLAHGKPEEEKTFVNTKLGLEYKEPGEAPDWQRLYDRREPWKLATVPRDGLLLTAGADVQKDRIEVYVWAWGRGLRRWLIDHIVIQGGPERAQTWTKLREVFAERWPHESGQDLRIEKLALDTGYDASAVYSFARAFGDYQLLVPIKGESHSYRADQPVRGPTYQDVAQGGKKIRRGVKLWQVSSAFFKNELYRQFRLDRPTDEEAEATGWPPGYVHLPGDLGSDQVRQLVAERRILRNGKYIWEKVGGQDRNEALDCAVYARAAAWLMQIDRWTPARWRDREAALGLMADEPPRRSPKAPEATATAPEASEPAVPPPAAAPRASMRPGFLGSRRGSWLR